MGQWTKVQTLYGVREQWVPEGPNDWPVADEGWMAPPEPCGRCGGRLQRFQSTHGGVDDARWRQVIRRWEILGKPDPMPMRPESRTVGVYTFDHYRDCLPSTTADEVTLSRPRRV